MKVKYLRLLHRQFDGQITIREARRLQHYLERDPDARKLARELQHSVQLLEQIPAEEPPANLKKQVMNSIDPLRYQPKPKWQPIAQTRPFFNARTGLAFAVGLSIGLLIAVLLIPQITKQFYSDPTGMSGNIGLPIEGNFQPFRTIPVETDHCTGDIQLLNRKTDLLILAELMSADSIQTRISFPVGMFSLHHFQAAELKNYQMDQSDNYISVTASGHQKFSLLLNRVQIQGQYILIELHVPNALILKETIEANIFKN
jgi:hypothetical protein